MITNPEDGPTTPREGVVTAIRPTRRNPNRLSVFLDGEFAFALAADTIAKAGLEIGDRVEGTRAEKLLAADETARATDAALAFLAYRPRSEREVRDRLRRAGFGPESIDQVIVRLSEWRYLDDADFARRWVESRTGEKPRGRRLLQQELWKKGVDRETAREAIDDADLDEAAAAEALARSRLPAYAGEDPAVARRRLGAYLARRGYGYDVVRGALERAMGTGDEEPGGAEDLDQ